MVLGKLPVPGRPSDLGYTRAWACCACRTCGKGVVWTFLRSSFTSLFFLPLSGRRPYREVKPKITNLFVCNFMHVGILFI